LRHWKLEVEALEVEALEVERWKLSVGRWTLDVGRYWRRQKKAAAKQSVVVWRRDAPLPRPMMFLAVLPTPDFVGIVCFLIAAFVVFGSRFDRAKIRSAVARSGWTLIEISRHPTPKTMSGARRYVVTYRVESGETFTQVCEMDSFNGVRFVFEQPVAREEVADLCLSCGAPMPNNIERCGKCGWTFDTLGGQFVIPEIRRPLPKCRVRPYRESDFEQCAELYRLNQPERFPPGYYDEFCQSLRDGKTMFFVTEEDGCIRGICGFFMYPAPRVLAWLCFGLVHPDFHGRGFGTVQLLARLAHLPRRMVRWKVLMQTVEKSESFYARFGFRGALTPDKNGNALWLLGVEIRMRDILNCRRILAAAGVSFATEKGEYLEERRKRSRKRERPNG
jgi:GNAT superfamily N-acetyltransferase/ribosomal protein L40E